MKYTEGVCGDGAAILCDGQQISIGQILGRLNLLGELLAENSKLEDALMLCKNKFEFYEAMEKFLAQHLKPSAA